jgi:hypothetical protein
MLAVGFAFLAAGCTRTAILTPVNGLALNGGTAQAQFKAYGMGTGEVQMNLSNGETFTGRYLLDREQNILTYNAALLEATFGKDEVLRRAAAESVSGTPLWSPGTVDVSSSLGRSGHCDLMNNNETGHGAGACQFSDGAIYKLTY